MLKSNLLTDIGLSEEDRELYFKYHTLVGDAAEECAYNYMRKGEDFSASLNRLHQASNNIDINVYTLDLMFLFACTGYLYEDYQKRNICDDVFITTMKDITYKIEECKKLKNVFGTFVAWWFADFLKMQRFGFNRLQFDVMEKHNNEMEIENVRIKNDTFSLSCHIPSSGPLTDESVMSSFKMAYGFFRDKLQDGILPIFCHSWLLYPGYQDIFKSNSPNIANFASKFRIIKTDNSKTFENAWRIFNMDYDGDTTKLPQKTKLQKGFVEYMNKGSGSFGSAKGVILFNGEKII